MVRIDAGHAIWLPSTTSGVNGTRNLIEALNQSQ